MSSLRAVWDCMFAPKLVKIYGSETLQPIYHPNPLEKLGDQVVHSFYLMWKVGIYTSPFLVGILYHKGYLESQGLVTLSKCVSSVGGVFVVSFWMRGIGRSQNPSYLNFLRTLQQAEAEMTPIVKFYLNKYDFDFGSWPVEFRSQEIDPSKLRPRLILCKGISQENLVECLLNIPFRVISYAAIHTFGIRLVYPGTIRLLQYILRDALLQGRSKLVFAFKAERFKLQTKDMNEIDTMFVNRRNLTLNGNTLVICCEGNAGFYEVGILATPLEAGYSILGWNHPGFCGSTGRPYPPQEQNAIDIVIQFAINKLGFRLEDIYLYGWSIGGYSTTWAAMNYPDVKGVILDATFDDILPLALNQMPGWLEPIVIMAIRDHMNLNVAEQLVKYQGPILLIRRTEDEVISLKASVLATNRGNNLLLRLLHHRFPCIVNSNRLTMLQEYLEVTESAQEDFFKKYSVDDRTCLLLLQSYISDHSKNFPMRIGSKFSDFEKCQMALFLAKKYMKDFKAGHCINLPVNLFQPPWDVNVEADFVFT